MEKKGQVQIKKKSMPAEVEKESQQKI